MTLLRPVTLLIDSSPFQAAYKTQNFKIAEYLYQLLPPDLSENKKFKSLYLLSLVSQ